jgi:glycosyltransferase involved in cell wall biosynthesis
MRILLMCEEDPESWASWSGITKSIVDHLRLEGHTVITQDIDLYGADRLLAGVATFSPDRRTWGTRFHLGAVPFRLRSRNANRAVAAHRDQIDLVLQIGATFQISRRFGIPYVMCCDSNIRVAQQGAATGFSNASAISAAALESIAARERVVYQGAAAIFPLCEHLRRSFIDDFQIPADRVHAVYAGPNFASGSIAAVPPSRRDAHPPTALFVGLQFHRKGGDLLVESFRRVRAQLPDARLILAGVPVGYVEGPGITCLGDLNKNRPEGAAALTAAYASADVFALPTRFEPFGIAFVEAMHFGLPCIGPDAWAVPEIIADGETGFTVPAEDVDTLSDRLLRLLSDPPLARRMGEAGRARAQRMFTWAAVAKRLTHAMNGVLEREQHTARPSTAPGPAALARVS